MKKIQHSAFSFLKEQVESYTRQSRKRLLDRQALIKRLNAGLVALTLVTVTSLPQFSAKNVDSPVQRLPDSPTAFNSSLKLDTSSYSLLVIEPLKIEIKPGKSLAQLNAEAQARRLAAANPAVDNDQSTTLPLPAETKHQMAQAAADKAGIAEHWKILDAIWTVESGGSGDSCVVSRADGRAIGPLQFMPGTFRSHATDSRANICKVTDSLEAAANLLKANGLAEGDVKAAVYSYNHSMAYVNTVKQVADSIQ